MGAVRPQSLSVRNPPQNFTSSLIQPTVKPKTPDFDESRMAEECKAVLSQEKSKVASQFLCSIDRPEAQHIDLRSLSL